MSDGKDDNRKFFRAENALYNLKILFECISLGEGWWSDN